MARGHKVESEASEKRKPGRKGNFHGKRLELLTSFLPDWERARRKKTTGDFWSTVLSAYWEKFHWRLPQDEDPSGDKTFPMDEDLTAEEREQKATTIHLVEKVHFFSSFVYQTKLLMPINSTLF
jgi:hypothetical protein